MKARRGLAVFACLIILLAVQVAASERPRVSPTDEFAPEQLMQPVADPRTVSGLEEVVEPWQPGAERRVRVRPEALAGERMRLELPDGRLIEAVTDERRVRGPGQFHWHGRFPRGDGRSGTGGFTVSGDRMVGQFTGPDGRYQIRPAPDGGHRLRWIDPRDLPEHLCPSRIPDPDHGEAYSPYPTAVSGTETAGTTAQEGDESPEVDVLLLYTEAAVEDLGGLTDSEADARLEILGAMDAANAGFFNSVVDMDVRTVTMQPWDLDESGSDDLHVLRQDADLADLRDAYAADLVALVGNYDQQFCGVAFVKNDYDVGFADWAFSLNNSVDEGICLATQVLAHELGHNMGLHHDPANAPSPNDLIEPFAYGHFVDNEFRTIMSYQTECTDDCPVIDHFSNPDVEDPGGSGFATGLPDERDNARVLGKTAPVVEQFRETERSLGEVLGMPWADWESGGFAVWLPDAHPDGDRALSGEVLGDEGVWFEAPLVAGEYEFDWQMVEFSDGGELQVSIDGDAVESFDADNTDEQSDSVTVSEQDSGATVRWTFRPAAGADFGTERMILSNLQDADAEAFSGRVINVHGQPIEEAEIMVAGDPVAWTDDQGEFHLAFNPEAVDTDALTIGGEGLVDRDVPFADCSGSEGCEVTLEGETRTVPARLENLLEGEQVEVRVMEPSAGDDGDSVFTDSGSADGDGVVGLELQLDAAVDHEPAAVTAFGYEQGALTLPDSLSLRRMDSSGSEADAISLALEPRVPELVEVTSTGEPWRGFGLAITVNPNERAGELVLEYGRAGSGLDREKRVSIAATGEIRERRMRVRGLDCGSEYSWRLQAISDRGDASGAEASSLRTRDCGRVPGCSLAGRESHAAAGGMDPQIPLLLLVALLGLLRGNRLGSRRRQRPNG